MNINKKISLIAALTLASSIFTGCATTSLQTKTKLTRTITLDHSRLNENKVVYLQVTNTSGSGGENMKLYESTKEKLTKKGYTVSDSSKNASYGIFINVLFSNNLKEANAIKGGLTTGSLVGGGAYTVGTGAKEALIAGASAALIGGIVGKALEDDIFRAVVDITIREYADIDIKTLRTTTITDPEIINVTRAGNENQLSGPIGDKEGSSDLKSGIIESTTTETTKNYEEHMTRALAEAIKMDLKLDDAMKILEDKLSTQISNLF